MLRTSYSSSTKKVINLRPQQINIGGSTVKRFASSKKNPSSSSSSSREELHNIAKESHEKETKAAFAYSLRELRTFYTSLVRRATLPEDLNSDFRKHLPEYKNKDLVSEEDLNSISEVQDMLIKADEKLKPIESKLQEDIDAVAPKNKEEMSKFFKDAGWDENQIDSAESFLENPKKLEEEMSGLEDMYKQLLEMEQSLSSDAKSLSSNFEGNERGPVSAPSKKKSTKKKGTKKKKKKSKDAGQEGLTDQQDDMEVPGMGSMADLMKQMADQDQSNPNRNK